MKKFKAIYYAILSLLTVVMLVLGMVAASVPYNTTGGVNSTFTTNVKAHLKNMTVSAHSTSDNTALGKVRSYITDQLKDANVKEQTDFEQTNDELYGHIIDCDYAKENDKPTATYFVQTDVITQETVQKINSLRNDDNLIAVVNKKVNNIIVVIPGTQTIAGQNGDAVIMTAHYDSMPQSKGASDNGLSVAAMLHTIESIVSQKKTFKNDLVFVFTDAEEEGAYGAYAFRYQFKGFNDVYSRAKLGINFEGMGSNGALALFEHSDNINLVSAFNSKVSGVITDSAFAYVYSTKSEMSDFAIFNDINALNLSNIGNTNIYQTSLDTEKNVNAAAIKAKSNLVTGVVSAFANYNLSDIKEGDEGVYFSYLGFFNVAYSNTLAYVFAIIILVLIAGALILNIFKKAFSYVNLLSGMGIQITSLISATAITAAIYFLVNLLLVGFGVMPFRAIMSLHYINNGMIIGAMLLFFAVLAGCYYFYKKSFRIKAADVVRGSAVLFGLIGVITSFVLPQISYLFGIVGMLQAVVLLLEVLLKDKFRSKFGMSMERLFLYAVPMLLIALPMFVVNAVITLKLLPTIWILLYLAIFGTMLGVIAPYCDFLIPALNAIMAKLPKRTIRVERTVVEKVEDKAKKGKFTTQEVKKVSNEKIDWTYNHGVGLIVVALVSVIIMIFSSAFAADFGTAYTGSYDYSQSYYKDSLIYVWDKNGNEVNESVEIHDHMAYKYMSKALNELKWDSTKKAYVKEFTGNTSNIMPNEPTFEYIAGKILFRPYNGTAYSTIKVRLLDASDIDSVKVVSISGNEFTVTNEDKKDVIEIVIPSNLADYNTFQIEVDSKYSNIDVEYEQYVFGGHANNTLKNNLDDWLLIKNYYDEKPIYDNLRCGMLLKYTKTISM